MHKPAFTLIELLIVVVIIGIAVSLAAPVLGDSRALKVQEAARLLAADLELAQIESLSHPDDPRLVRFDPQRTGYWIAPVSAPATPVNDLLNQPLRVVFGEGRAAGLQGVAIGAVSVGGDDELRFDAYGTPDQPQDGIVVLQGGDAMMSVRVAAGTGRVTLE